MHAGFHPERSADIARNDADVGRRNIEIVFGHAVAEIERRLVRRVHHHAPIRPKFGPDAARLHRVGRAAGDGEVQFRDVGGFGQPRFGRIDIATFPQEADIVGIFVPNGGGTVLLRRQHIGDDGKLVVIDFHRFGRFFGGGDCIRDHHRHGLSHEAHRSGGQQLSVGLGGRRTVRAGEAEAAGNGRNIGQV